MRRFGKFLTNMTLAICLIMSFTILPVNAAEPILPEGEIEEEDVRKFNGVPLYFQTDYPSVPYGNGTVATSGCGITCLSMVASYMLDEEILPDKLANEFGSRRDSNLGRMEYASETIGLTYEKEFDWSSVIKALEDGKVAIILVNENAPFTGCQHFIVFTGLTKDGKIMVNDPYGPNYNRLKDGFENGFEESEIRYGFSGAWVYDKEDK